MSCQQNFQSISLSAFRKKLKEKFGNKFITKKFPSGGITRKDVNCITIKCKNCENLTYTSYRNLFREYNEGGCSFCKYNKRNKYYGLTNKEVRNLSFQKFKDRFRYPKLKVSRSINAKDQQIDVYCTSCKVLFETSVYYHLYTVKNGGCSSCAKKANFFEIRNTTKEFIQKSIKKWGDKFSYLLTKYKNIDYPLVIVCKKHGQFKTSAYKHLNNKAGGCTECAKPLYNKKLSKRKQKQFQKEIKLREKAGLLDLSEACYSGFLEPVKLKCKFCSASFAVIGQHFLNGKGSCPMCRRGTYSGFSNLSETILKITSKKSRLVIRTHRNKGEFKIPNTAYHADGYNKKFGIIFEVYGDVFHGNPQRFDPLDMCHPYHKDKLAKDLYKTTMERESTIKKLGYYMITVWEQEWRNNQEAVLKKVLKEINLIKSEYYVC